MGPKTIHILVLLVSVLLIGCRGDVVGDRTLPAGRAVLHIQGRSVELPEDSELVRLIHQYAKRNRRVGPALVTWIPIFNLCGTPVQEPPWRAALLPRGRIEVHDYRGPSARSWSVVVSDEQMRELRRMAFDLRDAEPATKPAVHVQPLPRTAAGS